MIDIQSVYVIPTHKIIKTYKSECRPFTLSINSLYM